MSNNYYEEYLAKTNDNLRESTLLKKEKKKYSSTKTVFLIILVLVLLGEGFYLWQKNQATQNSVDNPTETLLPMRKPDETLVEINVSKSVIVVPKEEIIEKKVIEKNTTLTKTMPSKEEKVKVEKVIPKSNPKVVEKNTTVIKTIPIKEEKVKKEEKEKISVDQVKVEKVIPKITPKVVAKNTTVIKTIPEKEKKVEEKIKIEKVMPKTIAKVVEKNTSVEKILPPKVIVKKHPLESSLLKAIDRSHHPKIEDSEKRIDTFNKVILDRSVKKADSISSQLSEVIQASETKKAEAKELKESTRKPSYAEEVEKEGTVRKEEMHYVTVKSGDTLYKIAKRIYGDSTKFKIIFKANSHILKTATDLKIGQKLRVPKLKKGE